MPNVVCGLDSMSDALDGSGRFRAFNIFDDAVREALEIDVDTSILCGRVIRAFEAVASVRGLPRASSMRQRPRTPRRAFREPAESEAYRDTLHPARQAEPRRVRRAVQSHVPNRCSRCPSVRELGRGPSDQRVLDPGVHRRAAPGSHRPHPTERVPASDRGESVHVGVVRLTGKHTANLQTRMSCMYPVSSPFQHFLLMRGAALLLPCYLKATTVTEGRSHLAIPLPVRPGNSESILSHER